MFLFVAAVLGAAFATFSACTPMNPDYDAGKPHHTPEGFRNTAQTRDKSLGEFLRWRRERRQLDIPAPKVDLSIVPPELSFIHGNRTQFAVSYIGHATVLIQIGGVNVLTDPHFSERAFPVQFAGPKLAAAEGCDGGSAAYRRRADLAQSLRSPGHRERPRIEPAAEWSAAVPGPAPVQHWSRRTLSDRNETLRGGFVGQRAEAGQADGGSFFFAGDTGYGPDFIEIGRRFGGIDLALVPIGACEPRWFMSDQHGNPDEAIRIHRDIKARRTVGIHWGTFLLTDEPLDQPLTDLETARAKAGIGADEFLTLRHGQTFSLDTQNRR